MKQTLLIFLIVAQFIFLNCGDNKARSNEAQQANNTSIGKKEDASSNSSSRGDDIIGEWELVGAVLDTNDNLQIDDDERKKLELAGYKDYMNLSRDGSGLFTIAKMEGRYEITDPSGNGKKFLTWYDQANGPHKLGTIVKVTKEELQIKEPGGSGLLLWKRL